MIISPLQNAGALLTGQWLQIRPYVTQGFGERPEVYKQFGLKGHNGLDMRAKIGTSIYAPFEGVAKVINDSNGYGLHIKIRKDNLECVLGHLSSVLIQDGQIVYLGQKIGLTGNSGFSTAPHLHFGIRYLNQDGNVKDQNNGYAGYIDQKDLVITWKGGLNDTIL